MYAIIKTGGKQYKVAEGDVITVEKLAQAEKKDGKWYLGLAISLEELGRPGEALNAYRKAAALYLSAQSRSFAEQRIGVLGGKK